MGRIPDRKKKFKELLAVIELLAENVTSCCFIEKHKLFITTSGEGLSGECDGKVFSCEV